MSSEWTVEEVRAEAGYLGRFADVHAYEASKMLRAHANLLERQASAEPSKLADGWDVAKCGNTWTVTYTPPTQPAGVGDAAVYAACMANLNPLAEPSATELRSMRAAIEAADKARGL